MLLIRNKRNATNALVHAGIASTNLVSILADVLFTLARKLAMTNTTRMPSICLT
jgi:hypothetical protein